MGAGFALYVDKARVNRVLDVAWALNLRAFVAGHIEDGDKKVVIKPKNLTYHGDTLSVR
jgi:phosphoribosylformylglycinamidine cyclo-ligase